MNEKLQEIKISDIKITGKNPRTKGFKTDGSLKALIASIKYLGVRIPIHVRRHDGEFELIAGERRLYAAKTAGLKTIPAIVQMQGETTAFETTMAENEARIDLTLAEEIKKVSTYVTIEKNDIKAVADRLHMTEHQVRLRVNAAKKLSKKWFKLLEDGNSKVNRLSVEHLDLIARLPETIQNDILANHHRVLIDWNGKVTSLNKLDRWINDTYTHALNKALFATDDGCSHCQTRSDKKGQTELWNTETTKKEKVIFCLNAVCWQRKTVAMLKKLVERAKRKHGAIGYIYTTSYGSAVDLCNALGIDIQAVTPLHDIKRVAKSIKNAKPVIIIDGLQVGHVIWIAPQVSGDTGIHGRKKTVRVRTMAERRDNLKGLRLKLLYVRLKEAIEECEQPTDKSLKFAASVAAVYGFEGFYGVRNDKLTADQQAKAFRGGKKLSFGDYGDHKWIVDLAQAIWLRARCSFAKKIPFNPNATDALKALKDCLAVAKLVRFDWDIEWDVCCKAKKEPKSWDKLKADGTPK